MSKQYRVMLVDDDPFNFELIKPALGDKYELDFASSGEECLRMVHQQKPDIVLLDIDMPGIDGYETCRCLKGNPETQQIPVTFVSGYDSIEERLAGYEVGGNDYVVKPFSAAELRNKIQIAIENVQQKEALKQDMNSAMDTAMVAMTSSGELGVVVNFLRESFACDDTDALADNVLESFSHYGLNCSVQIRSILGATNKNGTGSNNALEMELLKHLASKGRIVDFGSRTIINFKRVSLLIKNMPLDAPDKYGRIKDNGALILEGAEARVKAIEAEATIKKHREALATAMERAQETLQNIEMKQQKYKLQSVQIMDDLSNDVEKSFAYLALSEEQENHLVKTTQTAVDKALTLQEAGIKVDENLRDVIKDLQRVMNNW
ncbi:MAG: response regulator [Gammaproteobacteria bacterium]|nr:response regulator [Gammaproteobacteria bacterium]